MKFSITLTRKYIINLKYDNLNTKLSRY